MFNTITQPLHCLVLISIHIYIHNRMGLLPHLGKWHLDSFLDPFLVLSL